MVRSSTILSVLSRLRVGTKFFLASTVFVLASLSVASVGALFLAQTHRQADQLFNDHLRTTQQTAALSAALDGVAKTALLRAQSQPPAAAARLDATLDATLIPRARQALDRVRSLDADSPKEGQKLDKVQVALDQYLSLRRTGATAPTGPSPAPQVAGTLAERTAAIFEPITALAAGLQADEAALAAQSKAAADRGYASARRLLLAGTGLSLLLGALVGLLLTRDLVPRVRLYSDFAARIAAGRPTVPLNAGGRDELAELGAALNTMVDQRARLSAADQGQAEYIDTLQVTSSEEEAHELIQRHLQRALPDSTAVVLQRNNSANRLQAATALDPDCELATRLVGAEPRSCLALRFARTHREGPALTPLLSCLLCAGQDSPSTCEPLLVGGEVIGSVLVTHEAPLDAGQDARIKTSVAQAAPVLANLRNLALAEFRANNDALTALPNKRATDDTLKRLVAQADRSLTPLTAIMLDLDHFKQINDKYGHGKGDEVLAAVGAVLQSCLRASDFAGRFGGEEFLVLLPDTGLDGAERVAEKMRAAVASISVPGVERAITVSLGIADLFEHAGTATGLLQEADRALYAAKAAGRNRVVTASTTSRHSSRAGVAADGLLEAPPLSRVPESAASAQP